MGSDRTRDAREHPTAAAGWSGAPSRERSGGFVDGVAVNGASQQLALDPDGVVAPAARAVRGGGVSLDVERMQDDAPASTRINGRVRLLRS